jgi:pilus assembly protein CpaB
MRAKPIILLVISISCGLIASFAVSQVLSERQGDNAPQTSGVLVAGKDISPMSKLATEMIRVEQWPIDRIPPGSLTDLKQVDGKYAKQRLYNGEPIIEAKLSSRGKDLVVPVGYRIFDVKVDDSNGGSGYISPGDRVDITGFFEAGNRFPVSKSICIMRNIEVAMVDGASFRDPEAGLKKAGVIQLYVLEKQYEVLDTASNLGKLKLSLRAPDADESKIASSGPDNGDSFIHWLKESEKSTSGGGVVSTTANSLSLLKGLFASVKPKPQPEEQREMMVVTPGSVSVYRWINGRKMPVLITAAEYYGSQAGQSAYQGYESYNQSGSTSEIPGLPSESPKPAANASEGNSTWDPTTGTWQTGGFTPVYPQSK